MLQKLAAFVLRLAGWQMSGKRPPEKKYIASGYPHTSNFDAIWVLFTVLWMGERPKVLIKASFYRWPIKRLFLWIGGVPVQRGFGAKDLVQQTVDYIESVDQVALMLAPEGSRSYQKYWKSGFYNIALAAGLPIYFCFVDYSTNELGINETPLHVTGNLAADMQVIRDFYEGKTGKYQEGVGPIRLKRE